MAFKISVNIEDKITIALAGELDIYAATEFGADIERLITTYKKDVLLDFKNLEYLDSSGLGALVAIIPKMRELNLKMYIINAKPRLRKLFKITKIEEMFEFVR